MGDVIFADIERYFRMRFRYVKAIAVLGRIMTLPRRPRYLPREEQDSATYPKLNVQLTCSYFAT
jgi:hypothetical protein